jgi:hypothetical protein
LDLIQSYSDVYFSNGPEALVELGNLLDNYSFEAWQRFNPHITPTVRRCQRRFHTAKQNKKKDVFPFGKTIRLNWIIARNLPPLFFCLISIHQQKRDIIIMHFFNKKNNKEVYLTFL